MTGASSYVASVGHQMLLLSFWLLSTRASGALWFWVGFLTDRAYYVHGDTCSLPCIYCIWYRWEVGSCGSCRRAIGRGIHIYGWCGTPFPKPGCMDNHWHLGPARHIVHTRSWAKPSCGVSTCRILYSQKIWRGIKFGSLVVCLATAKFKFANILYLHIYVWQSLTEPPNLNSPIFLQWRFGVQLPNLIPANISSYMVDARGPPLTCTSFCPSLTCAACSLCHRWSMLVT